jgi:TusA-related sulfurtransferase
MHRLVIALLLAGAATAASNAWESLNKLTPGEPIEVITGDHAAKGEFVSSSTESLTVRTPAGEQRLPRSDVRRVISRVRSHRLRNALIGAGIGVAVSLVMDQTIGTYLRNESNPDAARPLIWTVPIVAGAGIGAAIPSHPTIYRK